jgi:hypothetical protein
MAAGFPNVTDNPAVIGVSAVAGALLMLVFLLLLLL